MSFAVHKTMVAAVVTFQLLLMSVHLYAGDKYIRSDDRNISQGRELWLQNCESCHGYGIADAPVPMDPKDWDFRISKGEHVLYKHAIHGYIGPDYSMMPPRGGNDNLNDDEVKLAVDYMIFLASYYINKHETDEEVNNDSTTN